MQQRSIKELLQVMLDNKECFAVGLCGWAIILYESAIITEYESYKLLHYINTNRPSKYSSIKAFINRNDSYYWPKYDIKPRIKWIKYHIEKNN